MRSFVNLCAAESDVLGKCVDVGEVDGLEVMEPAIDDFRGGITEARELLLIVYIVRRGISYVPGYVRICSSMSWYENSP